VNEREHWVSLMTAARRLGISPDRVRQLVDAGRVVSWRSPLGRLIDADDLERLARERAAAPTKGARGG
jgi:excisionase family DNA binding protein